MFVFMFVFVTTAQRSWGEKLSRDKHESNMELEGKEKRLREVFVELEASRREVAKAREGSKNVCRELEDERRALSESRTRANELHRLGMDMERELTAMLRGDLMCFGLVDHKDPVRLCI